MYFRITLMSMENITHLSIFIKERSTVAYTHQTFISMQYRVA